jgi:hypothetical protein
LPYSSKYFGKDGLPFVATVQIAEECGTVATALSSPSTLSGAFVEAAAARPTPPAAELVAIAISTAIAATPQPQTALTRRVDVELQRLHIAITPTAPGV